MISFNKTLVLGLILAVVPAVKAMGDEDDPKTGWKDKVTALVSKANGYRKTHPKTVKAAIGVSITGATTAVLYKVSPTFRNLVSNVCEKVSGVCGKVNNSVIKPVVSKVKSLTTTQKVGAAATAIAVPVLGWLGYKWYSTPKIKSA